MKKFFFLCCAAALSLTSCVTTIKTAKTADLPASLYSATVADLDVAKSRQSTVYEPTAEIRRGGYANAKRAAIRQLLGDKYDVLVEPEFVISVKNNFFTKRIKKIEVSGRPANYTNFHSLGDKVWTDPVFRSGNKNVINK